MFFCGLSYAQNTISGRVTDVANQPIPGANVKIVGESAGAVTDFTGEFKIKTAKTYPLEI